MVDILKHVHRYVPQEEYEEEHTVVAESNVKEVITVRM